MWVTNKDVCALVSGCVTHEHDGVSKRQDRAVPAVKVWSRDSKTLSEHVGACLSGAAQSGMQ